jgi:hypothetical protein
VRRGREYRSTKSFNQAAIIAPFRVANCRGGNVAPMPGAFPDYPAPVIRDTELTMMPWGTPSPPRTGGPWVTNIRNTSSTRWRGYDYCARYGQAGPRGGGMIRINVRIAAHDGLNSGHRATPER